MKVLGILLMLMNGAHANSVADIEFGPYVRLPVKRTAQRWTVRATMIFGIRELDGRFLLDLQSRDNLASPSWLDSQGIPRDFQKKITIGQTKPIEWKGEWQNGAAIAFSEFLAAGRVIKIAFPYLVETQVFYPPQTENICCDGVLGQDFFRKYVVTLDPQEPANVRIWDPVLFRPRPEMEEHDLKLVNGRFGWKNARKAQRAGLPADWVPSFGLQASGASGLGKFRKKVLTLDLARMKAYLSPLRQLNGERS